MKEQYDTNEEENIENIPKKKKMYCKIENHLRKYLSLDETKRNVICKKCLNNNLNPQNFTYEFDSSSSNSINDLDFMNDKTLQCMHKCGQSSNYYCIDCKGLVCYNCLISHHINHQSDSVNFISNKFGDYIDEKIDNLTKAISMIDKELENHKKKEHSNENKEKKQEYTSIQKKTVNNALLSISNSIHNSLNNFEKEYENTFNDSANEIALAKIQSESSLNFINNSISTLNLLMIKLNEPTLSNLSKCDFIKSNSSSLSQIKSSLKQTTQLLNKITFLKYNYHKLQEGTLSSYSNLNNKLNSYVDTLITSIHTGNNSQSYHIHRFKSFQHSSMKYFKSTSISFSTFYDNITLIGLNLCGIYIHKSKIANPNYETINISKREYINIKVTITSKDEVIYNTEKKLFGAVNNNDPIVSIFFNEGLRLTKGDEYLITINNMNDESNLYGDYWLGTVMSTLIEKKVQEVSCNSTGITFKFKGTHDIPTDFDEFSTGLIEGIIFTKE